MALDSYAPMSHGPTRATPRWSVGSHVVPALAAGLVLAIAWVSVGPPLSASSASCGSTAGPPHELWLTMVFELWNVAPPMQLNSVPSLSMIVCESVTIGASGVLL